MPELVLPIIVSREGTHEEIVKAVAGAAALAYEFGDPDLWNPWLDGPMTKSVRRVKSPKHMLQIRDAFIDTAEYCSFGKAEVLALHPMDASNLPKLVARCQVAGIERERVDWNNAEAKPGCCVVVINPDITMSTGKTAAQVAHASVLLESHVVGHFENFIVTDDRAMWDSAQTDPRFGYRIYDAGRTEIAPGTLTVIGGVW